MTDAAETLHLAFGRSIPETLRTALRLLGRADRVIGLPQTLSVGPIDPAVRRAWARAVLQAPLQAPPTLPDDLDGDPSEVERAWAEATGPGIAPIFWACLASPMEHACFLAFAARIDGRPFDLVDATDLAVPTAAGVTHPWSLGAVRAHEIVAAGLFERRRPVPSAERQAAATAWSALCRENAPFRIVRKGQLISAPLAHYDALLVEQAGSDWEVAARLIGRVVEALSSSPALAGQGTGDIALFGRLLALGRAGLLEVAGPGPGMRDRSVRKPAA